MEFNFNQTVDTIESVPKDFQGLYVENDGKYTLSDDAAVKSAVSAITGLNRSLKAARGEAKDLKSRQIDLSSLSEYGSTPDSILEGFQASMSEATKGKKSQEDFQRQVTKVKEDLGQAHQAELLKEQARSQALTGQLHGILVTGAARSALAEAGAIDTDLALPFLSTQIKVTEEAGKFAVNVVDSTGDPRYSGTTGAPMSVNELVEEMKGQEKFGPLFKSDKASGAGTKPNQARQGVPKDTGDMSPKDQIKAGLEARQNRR